MIMHQNNPDRMILQRGDKHLAGRKQGTVHCSSAYFHFSQKLVSGIQHHAQDNLLFQMTHIFHIILRYCFGIVKIQLLFCFSPGNPAGELSDTQNLNRLDLSDAGKFLQLLRLQVQQSRQPALIGTEA